MIPDEVQKLYYSVGEIAERFNVTPSHVRFWVSEFGLDVKRSKRGYRKFTDDDVAKIAKIHDLIHVQGYTYAGAKRQFKP